MRPHASPAARVAAWLALGVLASSATAAQDAAQRSAEEQRARSAAEQVIRAENEHTRRSARIERLLGIYRARGDAERVRRLEELRERDATSHRAALARAQQELGTDRYERLRNTMRGQLAARAAAASREPAPTTVRTAERRANASAPQRPAPRPYSRGGGR